VARQLKNPRAAPYTEQFQDCNSFQTTLSLPAAEERRGKKLRRTDTWQVNDIFSPAKR
jgi:hypothetical protein